MPKRTTVSVDRAAVERLVDAKGWSNAYFGGTLMCKTKGWLTDWKRGKSLPSPEEAARMCAVLNAMPEEFLTEQPDIDKVTALIDGELQGGAKLVSQLSFGQKKDPTTISGDGVEVLKARIMGSLDCLSPDQLETIAALTDTLRRGKEHT